MGSKYLTFCWFIGLSLFADVPSGCFKLLFPQWDLLWFWSPAGKKISWGRRSKGIQVQRNSSTPGFPVSSSRSLHMIPCATPCLLRIKSHWFTRVCFRLHLKSFCYDFQKAKNFIGKLIPLFIKVNIWQQFSSKTVISIFSNVSLKLRWIVEISASRRTLTYII